MAEDFLARARGQLQVATRPAQWTPHNGPQREFIESTAEEVLYGGSAGGGKTIALAALPLPWIHHPQLRCLFLRRTTPQLQDLLDKARWVYKTGLEAPPRPFRPADPQAEFRGDKGIWTFSSGARANFNHCQNEDDWLNYQGHEYQIIGLDELTHFTKRQYLEIKSRLRSGVAGLPRQIRSTTNPGGPGHEWVFERWGPWLNPELTIEDWDIDGVRGSGLPRRVDADAKPLPPARPSQILYVATINGRECFSSTPFFVEGVPAPTRTFIPARLGDNPTLLASDPGYRLKLRDNDPVRRAQLEDGDWLVKPGSGRYFKRSWVQFVDRDAVPADAVRVRAWDKAATEPSAQNRDPDWTRGVRLARANDLYYVEDVQSLRGGPGAVKALLRSTAEVDGKPVWIRVPQDPGAAGKSQAADDVRALDGFSVTVKTVTGDKVTRFGPLSSQASPASTGAEHGRLRIVRAPWNEEFVRELEDFPDGSHDDIVDALSDAYDELSGQLEPMRIEPQPSLDNFYDQLPRLAGGRGF